ncbi:MAG TPA: 3-dehydroquinate synthase [Candidatus Angelobacter sp.]|nr:3-dehydroquinate synthase [Candidatus Angelobacter sp.]
MKTIPVRLKKNPYAVLIGSGLLRHAGREIRRVLPSPGSRVFVVTSPNVRRHWGDMLQKSLERAHVPYTVLLMNDGEPAKHMHTVEQLAEQMVDARADRKAMVIAFGGGVVGDAAGFLAAIFMRGIPVVQIPTTLLAQVDASIGGKTGVNLRGGKNLVGSFHQPQAVLIDPEVLSTLDDREFRAGLFESLKCGVIRDRALFDFMTKKSAAILRCNRKLLERIIVDSVRVKAAVVAADEKESDLRRILNFGHTVGHALESATGYGHFLHGEAVAWGMIAAAAIARDVNVCKPETAADIEAAVRAYGPLPAVPCGADGVLNRLSADKKTVAGAVHFVLPQKIGRVKIVSDVPVEVIRAAVEHIRNHG